jgi:hypothetical protein
MYGARPPRIYVFTAWYLSIVTASPFLIAERMRQCSVLCCKILCNLRYFDVMNCYNSNVGEYKYKIFYEVTKDGPTDVRVHPWIRFWWSRWMLMGYHGVFYGCETRFTLAVTNLSPTGTRQGNCGGIERQR